MLSQVIIDLGTATICFLGSCFPALVGSNTPPGEYTLERYTTDTPGFGGDLLVFKEDENAVWAIHRVLNVPGQQRKARLESQNPAHRINVTAGCVNINPEVYARLVDCCSNFTLIIK